MNRDGVREKYYFYSGKASDIARQLSFAGIAVIWIFHTDKTSGPELPSVLLAPLIWFSVTLALDLLQYAYASAAWGIYHRLRERRAKHSSDDPDIKAPSEINWPTVAFFWLKLSCIGVGQFLLLFFIAKRWALLP